MRSRFALIFLLVFSGTGCSEAAGRSDAPAAEVQAEVQDVREETRRELPISTAATPTASPAGTATYMDLLALSHLADVYDPVGLFIDFGTAARLKYTNGNWNSGWQGELKDGGTSVSTFG